MSVTGPETGNTIVSLIAVGKDYPILHAHASRLKTVFHLLSGSAVSSSYHALRDVTLSIEKGESWGVIGDNGAGKSTLLKIIAGVIPPSAGECKVDVRMNALLELGAGFHPELTGRENLFLAGALMGWSKGDVEERMDRILAFADIGIHVDQPIKTYSSGMVVRLGFAMAISSEPELLVTDEILAVGDESFQKKCLRWMEGFLRGGGSLILCSHSMYHIQTLCQKAVWIHEGNIRQQGNAYPVTQAYLAYHEERTARETALTVLPAALADSTISRLLSLQTLKKGGEPSDRFAMGDDIILKGEYAPSAGEQDTLMVGITRVDGTPIHGTFSRAPEGTSQSHDRRTRTFKYTVPTNTLLPGKYKFSAHTLDAPGLRMYDTMETTFVITGETRDHGFVRLAHEWAFE